MSQDKIQKARELVLNYIASHTLSDKLNRAVNEVCRSRPKDPWLFLSDIISEWTKDVPMIDRLVAKQAIDCYGNTSIQLQLFGRVDNARPPRYLGVENVFIHKRVTRNTEEKKDSTTDIKSIMQTVSEKISPQLRQKRIDEQTVIDKELTDLYTELQKEMTDLNIFPTISNLIADITANYLRMPLYKYLSKTKINNITNASDIDDDNINYKLPNLMCQILQLSNDSLPNLNIISTNHLKPIDRVAMLTDITNQFINILNIKNACFDTHSGGIIVDESVSVSDIDALMSLLNKAIENCDRKYEINTDFELCLSFSNEPKCLKYTGTNDESLYSLNGEQKGINDILQFFGDIISKYSIAYLEDPLHCSDKIGYNLLSDALKNVQIIGTNIYKSQMSEIVKGVKEGWTQNVCVSLSEILTVSNALEISNIRNMELLVSDNGMNNGMSIDLGIAMNAKCVRLAVPNCGRSVNEYNRWLMIAEEMSVEEDSYDEMNENESEMNGGSVNEKGIETIEEQNENVNGSNDKLKENVVNAENMGSDADKGTEDLP